MTTLLSLSIILLLSIFAISAVIFIDIYGILKVNNREIVDVNILKFNKCILPYNETYKKITRRNTYEKIRKRGQ